MNKNTGINDNSFNFIIESEKKMESENKNINILESNKERVIDKKVIIEI
jgi:hypothetical protein